MTRPLPDFLYHWSPSENRRSIATNGLLPGSMSNGFDWTPPHVCYAETPARALSPTFVDGALDLWMVRTDGTVFTRALHRMRYGLRPGGDA